jgi:hypothetical protein
MLLFFTIENIILVRKFGMRDCFFGESMWWAAQWAGLSSLGVPGVPWHPQILGDQLTLSQPGGEHYAHHITTGTPGFSYLPTALMGQI